MKLSVVDITPVPQSGDRHEALKSTLELAQKAEEWGYERFWVAEHHGVASVAGRNPEVLIPYIAAQTKKIRLGSGSVLLNHYSPYKVAEVFSTLEELFPGRIDMGIGRATTGPIIDIALQRNRTFRQTSEDSAEQLSELLAWMESGFDPKHPFSQVTVHNNGTLPQMWLLGSSGWSASAAALLGLRYTFAGFIKPEDSFGITRQYLQEFKPSDHKTGIQTPELILCLGVYCAESDEAAARFAAPAHLRFQRLRQNGDLQSLLETEEHAIQILGGLPTQNVLKDPTNPPRILAGSPKNIKKWLTEIAEVYGAQEIMIQCISSNHQGRMESLRLIAKEFGQF